MAVSDARPFYLNLFKIKLPIQGMVSIFHRVTGVLMFFAIPFYVYLLDISLAGESGFTQAAAVLNQPIFRLINLILLWSLIHHFLAGIRFLFIDFDIAVDKAASRKTAWSVFVLEVILMALILLVICL